MRGYDYSGEGSDLSGGRRSVTPSVPPPAQLPPWDGSISQRTVATAVVASFIEVRDELARAIEDSIVKHLDSKLAFAEAKSASDYLRVFKTRVHPSDWYRGKNAYERHLPLNQRDAHDQVVSLLALQMCREMPYLQSEFRSLFGAVFIDRIQYETFTTSSSKEICTAFASKSLLETLLKKVEEFPIRSRMNAYIEFIGSGEIRQAESIVRYLSHGTVSGDLSLIPPLQIPMAEALVPLLLTSDQDMSSLAVTVVYKLGLADAIGSSAVKSCKDQIFDPRASRIALYRGIEILSRFSPNGCLEVAREILQTQRLGVDYYNAVYKRLLPRDGETGIAYDEATVAVARDVVSGGRTLSERVSGWLSVSNRYSDAARLEAAARIVLQDDSPTGSDFLRRNAGKLRTILESYTEVSRSYKSIYEAF